MCGCMSSFCNWMKSELWCKYDMLCDVMYNFCFLLFISILYEQFHEPACIGQQETAWENEVFNLRLPEGQLGNVQLEQLDHWATTLLKVLLISKLVNIFTYFLSWYMGRATFLKVLLRFVHCGATYLCTKMFSSWAHWGTIYHHPMEYTPVQFRILTVSYSV